MNPYWTDGDRTIYCGDCLEILPQLQGTGIITDPPYELGFMGKDWDKRGVSFQKETWQIIRDSCLPGSMLLSFGGTRTFHRIAVAIEDAGWELRDTIMWLYAQGFPKGKDVAWDMHKVACNSCGVMVEYDHDNQQAEGSISETEYPMRFVRATYLQTPVYACSKCGQVLQPFLSEQEAQSLREAWTKSKVIWSEQPSMEGWGNLETPEGKLQGCQICQMSHGIFADGSEGWLHHGASASNGKISWQVVNKDGGCPSYRPQSFEQYNGKPDAFQIERQAQTFRGWNICLKPAYEPILVCMNPLDGTFANNALKHGVAGLNIDGCRIPLQEKGEDKRLGGKGEWYIARKQSSHTVSLPPITMSSSIGGRFPANIIHDGSEEVLELFPQSAGQQGDVKGTEPSRTGGEGTSCYGEYGRVATPKRSDSGSAARFFYCAKASKSERNRGCEGLERQMPTWNQGSFQNHGIESGTGRIIPRLPRQNNHPTVKPLALMKYLVKLISSPKDAVIIDPFMGSGTTLIACKELGIKCIGIDTDEYACEIAVKRCQAIRQEVMELEVTT